MPTYAKQTEVSSDQSKVEIERTLRRYRATAFMYGWDEQRAVISFQIQDRRYRIVMAQPIPRDFQYTENRRLKRTQLSMDKAYEQAVRQRWRAMSLYIKAILEAAESGIVSIEQALTPFVVLPSGQTVGEWLQPQLEAVYTQGRMPPLLSGASSE